VAVKDLLELVQELSRGERLQGILVLTAGVVSILQKYRETIHHWVLVVCRELGMAVVAEIDNMSLGAVERKKNPFTAGLAFGISIHVSHRWGKGSVDIIVTNLTYRTIE
jgi:hypothetical protein